MSRRKVSRALGVAGAVVACFSRLSVSPSHAAPAPEIEYMYDVTVRRHYNVPDNDALGYGRAICDKIGRGQPYAQIMSDIRSQVTPNDEASADYLVSNAVNLLCPEQIWQLRNSAAEYRPPAG